jgi:hypothetical protein
MKTHLALAVMAALGLGALAGCASAVPRPSPLAQAADGCRDQAGDLLAYAQSLRGMSAPDLAVEVRGRQEEYAARPSPLARSRLALARSVEGAAAPEPVRRLAPSFVGGDVCAVLDGVLAAVGESEEELASARAELKEQRRRAAALERELRQGEAQGREAQQQIARLQRALVSERSHAAAMEQQLEELRDIDRRLESRRAGGALSPRPTSNDEQGENPSGR